MSELSEVETEIVESVMASNQAVKSKPNFPQQEKRQVPDSNSLTDTVDRQKVLLYFRISVFCLCCLFCCITNVVEMAYVTMESRLEIGVESHFDRFFNHFHKQQKYAFNLDLYNKTPVQSMPFVNRTELNCSSLIPADSPVYNVTNHGDESSWENICSPCRSVSSNQQEYVCWIGCLLSTEQSHILEERLRFSLSFENFHGLFCLLINFKPAEE